MRRSRVCDETATSTRLATSDILSPPPHEPADGAHQLARLVAAVAVAEQAHARVVVEQAQRDTVQPRLDRGDRREHVDAVRVLLHHAGDVADLRLDTGEVARGRGAAAQEA